MFKIDAKTKRSTNNALSTESKKDQRKRIKRQRIAQNVFRYNAMMENGICVMDDDLYSRAIRFTDINYQIAPNDIQEQIIYKYANLLNSLGSNVDVSLVINNRLINREEFEQNIIMKHRGDGLDQIRGEMNSYLLDNMQKGNNSIISDKMFVFTCKEKNYQDAIKTLESLSKDFQDQLQGLGCNTEVLTGRQRLEGLATITKPGKPFVFDYKDLTPKSSSKDTIAPYAFDFKKDYFIMDDRYCSVMVLQNYPTWLQDKLISELSKMESNLLMTFHMQIKSKEDSLVLINQTSSKVDMQIDTENQKNLERANFSGKLPPKLQAQEESVAQWRVAIEEDDQRMFQCQFLILVNAPSYDEMLEVKKDVERIALRWNCGFITMNYEQEAGFNCVLPLGLPKEGLGRNLLTDNCSRVIPFTSQELLHEDNPIFYGINKTTNNMILCHRKHLANQNGFILGKSGSGKSFKVKEEISWLFLNDEEADIIIIDPQGEYKRLSETFNKYSNTQECQLLEVNNHSDLHFNPFEGDISQPDYIQRKAEIVTVMMAEMYGNGTLTGEQRSIIDQCVHEIYRDYEANLENNPTEAKTPTLKTFYEYLGKMNNPTAHQIHSSLWTYVNGSFDLFAKESNVDITSRMVIYDISELRDSISTLGLKIILENVREQVLKNHRRGRRTWIYIDEIWRLLKDKYSEAFLAEFWKWVRKFGGACTAISQNVSEILCSQEACTMLSNSEFYIIMGQEPIDLVQLKALLGLSEEQARFVNTANKGNGLLRFGNTIIPFTDQFPKDTICYAMWNTDPKKKQKERTEYYERLKEQAIDAQKQARDIHKSKQIKSVQEIHEEKKSVEPIQKDEALCTVKNKNVEQNIKQNTEIKETIEQDTKKEEAPLTSTSNETMFDPSRY